MSVVDLLRLADNFDSAHRLGRDEDKPEGSRYIIISDTAARKLAQVLRDAGETLTQLHDAEALRSLPSGFIRSEVRP